MIFVSILFSITLSQIAASDLGLHCLLRPVCPNTKGYYGISNQELLSLEMGDKRQIITSHCVLVV